MYRILMLIVILVMFSASYANAASDNEKIVRAVLDYIESQHNVDPELMKRGLDQKLAKRTYWQSKEGE